MLARLKTSTNKEGNVLCILIAYCDAFGFERCLSDFLWMSSSVIGWPASSHEIGRNPKNIISPKLGKYNIAFPSLNNFWQVSPINAEWKQMPLSEKVAIFRSHCSMNNVHWNITLSIWTLFIGQCSYTQCNVSMNMFMFSSRVRFINGKAKNMFYAEWCCRMLFS